MSKLITFTGSMGAGKSTAISALSEFSNQYIKLVKFADPLYRIQEAAYNEISSVYKRPKDFIKDRKLLQWLGTEWGRQTISTSIWVDLWQREVEYLKENYPDIIITCDDVRFDNEAETVKKSGGIIIKILSDKNSQRIDTTKGINNHKSEEGISDHLVDLTVANNGTLKNFKEDLFSLYKSLLPGYGSCSN